MSNKQSSRGGDSVDIDEGITVPSGSCRSATGKMQPGSDGLTTAMGGVTVQPGTYRSPKASSASGARSTLSAPEQSPSGAESSGGSDSSEENSGKNTGNE